MNMLLMAVQLLSALWLLLAAPPAHALLTCTLSPPSVVGPYLPGWDTRAIGAIEMDKTLSCTRTVSGDPTDITIESTGRDSTTSPPHVDATTSTGAALSWHNKAGVCAFVIGVTDGIGPSFIPIMLAATVNVVQTFTLVNYVCVEPAAWVMPGNYVATDQWQFRIRKSHSSSPDTLLFYNNDSTWKMASNTNTVTFQVPAYCALSTTSMTISLAYATMQSGASTGSAPFGVQCNTVYDLTLSPTSGRAAGIDYTLNLTNPSNAVVGPCSKCLGNTTAPTNIQYRANASAPGSQYGDCTGGCTQSNSSHTITVNY